MDARELAAKAWGLDPWQPTPEHDETLAFAQRLDRLENVVRGVVAVAPLHIYEVSARLRTVADDLDEMAESLGVPRQ